MADVEALKRALINADQAGDVAAATALAKALRAEMEGQQQAAQPEPQMGSLQAMGRGALQGATISLADEMAGFGAQQKAMWQGATDRDMLAQLNAARDAGDMAKFTELQKQIMQGGFGARDQATQEARALNEQAAQQAPGSYIAGNIAGAVATLPLTGGASFTANLPKGAALGSRMLAGTKDAALYGGAYGFGAGTDTQSRVSEGLTGALTGAALGGAIPAVAQGVKTLAKPFTDAVKGWRDPSGYAAQKLSERLSNDGKSLAQIERKMQSNPGMSLADVSGDNTRNLLRTVTNIPGKAQETVAARLRMRQLGQGDRLKDNISRTFANPDAYLSVKDDIAATAKQLASPLYEKAYANPVPFTFELEGILKTPSGRAALQRAAKIAGDEQAPFAQWFANIADDGKVTIKRVPDMRAWDYIKRGFDDVIDSQTDSITGKITTSGRAVVGLKNRLLGYLDKENPVYAQARKVAADGFRLDDALEFGRKSQQMSAEAVRRKFASFSEAEQQAARVGYAEALRKNIDAGGWTHNKIRQVMGSPEQYRRLQAMFKSKDEFKTFRQSIINEARKQRTFDTVRGNSTTAKQLMDLQDAGMLAEGAGMVKDAASGNLAGIARTASAIISRMGGLTPEVASEMANRLMATNPAVSRSVMQELQKISASNAAASQKAALVQSLVGRITASQTAQ